MAWVLVALPHGVTPKRPHALTLSSPAREQLKNKSLQIFCLRKMRQNRVIKGLGQRFDPAKMLSGVDAGIHNNIQKG
jgi:hypothetical protein